MHPNHILQRDSKLDRWKQIPVFVSNPDFVWSNEHSIPRFGQGAFVTCLEKLWETWSGRTLEVKRFGKPMRATYEFAENVLESIAIDMGVNGEAKKKVYAIGDNPASDIAGANAYGWDSFLVKTGVWNPEQHGREHGATHVVKDVEEAVEKILKQEGVL
ncbi:hypothetical protein HK096_002349 [Nowakowskiella sp. JEL0078]|nr:hypothetical protein HK096_002349 [Nowakowskiella sp. JEL0078]